MTTVGFCTFFALTLVMLGGTVFTGRKRLRRPHLGFVAGTLCMLGATIYFAKQLGDVYDVHTAGPIAGFHLTLAKATTVWLLVPVATGAMTWRNRKYLRFHRPIAYFTVGLMVTASVSGIAMIMMADRIA